MQITFSPLKVAIREIRFTKKCSSIVCCHEWRTNVCDFLGFMFDAVSFMHRFHVFFYTFFMGNGAFHSHQDRAWYLPKFDILSIPKWITWEKCQSHLELRQNQFDALAFISKYNRLFPFWLFCLFKCKSLINLLSKTEIVAKKASIRDCDKCIWNVYAHKKKRQWSIKALRQKHKSIAIYSKML